MNRLIAYESVRFTGQFPKFSMTKYSVDENLSGKKNLNVKQATENQGYLGRLRKREEPIKVK
jgi:hypothetical protein